MRWRRLLVLFVLLGLLVGVVLWLRPSRRPPAGSAPDVAAVAERTPASKQVGGRAVVPFAWLGQRGVAGRRIAGRVLHAGQPVAKAAVRLTTQELHVGEWPVAQVESDDAGRFDLGLRPASQYRVVAQAEGLVAAGAVVDLRAPDPRPPPDALTIELRDCDLVVRGTVNDAAGGVIVGAQVRAGSYSWEFGITASDEEGRYRVCVSAGPVHIEAGADGYGTVVKHTHGRGEVPLDFQLAPEIVIAGRVVDGEGAPIGGAVVVAATNGHDPGVVAESAADGRFRLERLAAGSYLVVARADDRAAEKSVKLAAGGAIDDLVLALEPRTPLSGRVVVGGRPGGGATVIVSSVDGPWKLGSAVSQADGRFAISGLPRGAVKVGVEGHNLVSPDATLDLAVVHEVELVCERQVTVSGRVLRGGQPVVRPHVYLYQDAARPHRVVGNDDGRFKMEGVAAGTYQLHAQSLAQGASMARRPLEVGARDIDDLVLELDLSASVAGIVVDATGAPAAGLRVHLYREDGDIGSDVTAADGTFLVTALAGGGGYQPMVSGDNGANYRPPSGQQFPAVRVADGKSRVTGVRITIVRGTLTISGHVTRGGKPVTGVDIGATSEAGGGRAQSGPDGTFVLGDLAPGTYELYVERRGGGGENPMRVEAGAKDVRIELPPVGAIEGVLRGFRGAPQVTVVDRTHGRMLWADATDAKFSVADVPVGTYDVHAVAANGAHGTARVTVAIGQVARVTLEAGPTAQVTGVVTDWRTGAPITGAYCSWYAEDGASNRPARSDASGGFAFGVPAGPVRVMCHALDLPSFAARDVTVDLAPGATTRVAVELLITRRDRYAPPGVWLEGRAPAPLRIAGLGQVAGASGLRVGDIVVRIDGRSTAGLDGNAVSFLIADHDASAPASVTVDRDGAELSFDVPPEARPPDGQ